jgi:uncharacterized protein YkwD
MAKGECFMPLASAKPAHSRDLRATRFFTVLSFASVLFLSPLVVVHANQSTGDAERALFEAANRERVALGLRPLQWDNSLASAAREHALRMAQRNTLSHQFPGELPLQDRTRLAGARFSSVAENVAEGPTAEMIHVSWMHSPPHRANLLDPQLNSVGIAVAILQTRSYPGGPAPLLFAVEDFSQSVANLNYQEQERQVAAQLAARGLQVSASDDARKTCEMDRGWSGNRPGLVVRYEATDLSRLPDDLEQKIQTGRYRAAAVGACESSGGNRGFTRFRLAVLLF